jgi:hypothetical protein
VLSGDEAGPLLGLMMAMVGTLLPPDATVSQPAPGYTYRGTKSLSGSVVMSHKPTEDEPEEDEDFPVVVVEDLEPVVEVEADLEPVVVADLPELVVADLEPVVVVADLPELVVADLEPVVAALEPVVADWEPVVAALPELVVADLEPVVADLELVVADLEPEEAAEPEELAAEPEELAEEGARVGAVHGDPPRRCRDDWMISSSVSTTSRASCNV